MPTSPNDVDTNYAPNLYNVRWQFIDSSDNSRANLTQVKRHVMQEYMRQKKSGTRQSEGEGEHSPTKPGRPRKTRVAKRRSEKQARSKSDSNSKQPRERRSIRKQPVACTDDFINQERRSDLVQTSTISNALLNESDDMSSILSFQTSHTQSGSSLPIDNFGNIPSPSSQRHDPDFNNLSWSPTSTTSYQSIHSPNNIVDAARPDTFNTIPMDLDRDGQGLFDLCFNDMPGCSYGPSSRSALAPHWYTAAFVPEEMKGKTPNPLSNRDHVGTVLRDHLSNNPHDTSDVAIISCLTAASLEYIDSRPGHKEIGRVHMRAAREMIRARGGPSAFANTPIGTFINWQDYIPSGYEPQRPSIFHEYEQPTPISSEAWPLPAPQPIQNLRTMSSSPYSISSAFSEVSTSPEPRTMLPSPLISSSLDEIKLQCEEFLDFLRRCEHLALYQREHPQSSYIIRHTAVQETSNLRQILVSTPDGRSTTSEDPKRTIARLTTLMVLNAALWDYRYTPARTAIFLSTLEKAMADTEVEMSGSVETILQILLECNDGSIESGPIYSNSVTPPALGEYLPDFSQYYPTATSPFARPWFVGRMLKVAIRLSDFSWHRISELLFSCLTLQVQDSSTALWEADLRKEVFDAPLTGHDMHSLIK
ncbi:hypothetical protein N7457_008924 [Penicillium paradoxum]|uniref:uncharacterized protein n=1 Tax=Penicillium paradoxum TaxID=176176 RepID=UPI00254799A6|nr:uncharacterized protein N7457_008924 [Penicillium paradoxum]KAJ5774028.1 hypothetical protein N7457_008924 [Penicillium paradoxum]